jgi:DNA-binding transcriptional LysR family regulator
MNSNEAIKYAVREGLGVSVVSSLSVEDYLELGLIHASVIEGLDLQRSFYLVTHKNRPLSPCAAAYRKYVLKCFMAPS